QGTFQQISSEVHIEDLEGHISFDKDSEKTKIRRPHFSMPKISLPKMKSHKAEISVPQLHADMTVSTIEDEGKMSLQMRDTDISGSDSRKGIKMPEVKLPSLELSKPELKVPKMDMEISLPESDVKLSIPDASLSEAELKSLDVGDNVSKTMAEIKVPVVKGLEVGIEGPSTDISVDVTEIKTEGMDGKMKRPKFQRPKFGISFSKGKTPDTEISLPSEDAKVPQLKTTADIADIAVEAPTLEGEGDLAGSGKTGPEGKIKIPLGSKTYADVVKLGAEGQIVQIHKTSSTAPTSEISVPNVDIDMTVAETHATKITVAGTEEKVDAIITDANVAEQSPDAKTEKESQIKSPKKDIQGKESIFKMPKFSVPSFGWPMEFNIKFPTEKIDTMNGKIQKSVAKITTLTEPDIQTTQLECKLPSTETFIQSSSLHIEGPYFEGNGKQPQGKSAFDSCDSESQESFSTQIVRESEIPPSEVQTATYGFSLLKVKIQESLVNLDMPVKLSSTEYTNEMFESKDHQPSGEKARETTQKTSFAELKVSDKGQELIEEASSTTKLTKLKAFAVEVQSSDEFADSSMMSESAVEITEETEVASAEEESTTDPKEKSDSKRSSGRFKFWLPSLGFSSSVDDTGADSKPEVQKPFQEETEVDVPSTSDSDTAKQTEKAGWFRFPKLGFSSPTKKGRETDKVEETDPKEEKPQDEESPTEKSETFFDAQESLPPNETIAESETSETSPIVSSSARTELILLEKGKAPPQSVPEEA
uniref:Protein AHNAK2 n=1 Tax=Podarcis muralis TaxID=64176 RepID=A0A670I8V1_PODMU